VVVGLGDGLRGPVLVHRADLELLEVAAVWMRAARLACCLIGVDFVHGSGACHLGGPAACGRSRAGACTRPRGRACTPPNTVTNVQSMRNHRDFLKPLAIGAPEPILEIPFKPSRMIHFLDFSNEKMVAKVP